MNTQPMTSSTTITAIAAGLIASLGLIPSLAAGKPGGPGSTASQILPINVPLPSNCPSGEGVALNNATGSLFTVGSDGSSCTTGSPRPLLWSAATGALDLVIAENRPANTLGTTQGVSDDGTAVGEFNARRVPFVRGPGGPAQALPLLPGMLYAVPNCISANGQFIAGENDDGNNNTRATLWTSEFGIWTVHDLGPGAAVAVANNGTTAGNQAGAAWVQPLGGMRLSLEGTDAHAQDIGPSGSIIVGFRQTPTTRDPTVLYPVPVYWKKTASSAWSAHVDLTALDGVDSKALGVGERNGTAIIVGFGFTKKDAIQRAVAWLPSSNGNYAAPVRLGALAGRLKAWAEARDVNSIGQVVGTSAGSGLTHYPVLWTLP